MPQQIQQIVDSLYLAVLDSAPRVVLGVVAAIALLILASVIERVLRAILTRIRFDSLLAQAGLDRTLTRLGIRQSLNTVLPRLAYFLLLLLFAQIGSDAFGLLAISDAIGSLFGYLPKIIAAILLLVVGTALSQFVGEAVARGAEESGIEFGRTLGNITSGFILFIVAVMAIGQLEFDTEMVRIATACVLGGFALAFALSVGLGTREITRNVLSGFYARKLFSPGDLLEVAGHRGVLREITPTQTLLEQDGAVLVLSNNVFLKDAIRK